MSAGNLTRRGKSSWRIKFEDAAGQDGRRRTRYLTVRGTKREAQAKLVELLDQVNKGTFITPSKGTLGEFLDRWQRDWAAINVSPKSAERYGELIGVHIKPALGATALQELRPVQVAEFYARLLRDGRHDGKGLAPRTIRQVHAVLHKALAVATDWDLIATNMPDRVKPPRVPGREIEIIPEDQVARVLRDLRDHPLYPIAALALATGLRRGELLALTWNDIDLDRARLRVERSIEQTRDGLRAKAPKTQYGRRTVTLAPWVVRELREHRKAQLELRLQLGAGQLAGDDLLFPTIDGGPRNPNNLTREWANAAKRLGLPGVTLHALRHTHASQLIAAGLDVVTISRRLGHGGPGITLGVYGHLFANTDDRAAQVIENAFGRIGTE